MIDSANLDGVYVPGADAVYHSYWLFPVCYDGDKVILPRTNHVVNGVIQGWNAVEKEYRVTYHIRASKFSRTASFPPEIVRTINSQEAPATIDM